MARRKAKEATPLYLERVALWYLARYPGSVARVRQALEKRVRRSVKELESDPQEGARNVAIVIDKLKAARLLDDARFARARVRKLRKRGKSARAISSMLHRQGISQSFIDEAVAELDVDGNSDLEAARAHARRKRLGPHRPAADRKELYQKDLARLARAGFPYAVAKEVLAEEL